MVFYLISHDKFGTRLYLETAFILFRNNSKILLFQVNELPLGRSSLGQFFFVCLFVLVYLFKHITFLSFFLAVLGLRFSTRAFSSCGKRGPLFIAVRGPLTIAASPIAEHRLQTRRLSNCGSRAQLLRGMWDLPRPGLEPVSPALAGGLSTTAPPGKPPGTVFSNTNLSLSLWSLALP